MIFMQYCRVMGLLAGGSLESYQSEGKQSPIEPVASLSSKSIPKLLERLLLSNLLEGLGSAGHLLLRGRQVVRITRLRVMGSGGEGGPRGRGI